MLSVICLDGIKPVWSGDIKVLITLARRSAKICPKIFKSLFITEMGQKFWGRVWSLPGLGIRDILASSISSGKCFPLRM